MLVRDHAVGKTWQAYRWGIEQGSCRYCHVAGRICGRGIVLRRYGFTVGLSGSCEGSRPGYFVPNPESFTTKLSVISGGEQVASGTKVRGEDAVHLDKALGVPSGLEPPHSPLPLPRWLMRVLSTVI